MSQIDIMRTNDGGQSTAPLSKSGLRRMPVQQRSTERVNRMLDACAVLLDEMGYEKLTTTLIAQRADVAIGSVYQFFGDKRAVVRALDLRYLERFISRLADHIAAAPELDHWSHSVDIVIDEYIRMHRTEPGFRTLHFGDVVDVYLLDEERCNDDVLADRLHELLSTYFELPDDGQVAMVLTIAVTTGDALVKLAFRSVPEGDEVILTEAKKLIRGYLGQHIT